MSQRTRLSTSPPRSGGRVPWGAVARVVAAVAVCQGAGVLGVLLTDTGDSPWYRELRKPSFNPPPGVFGPVWITLYTLMGVSLSELWRKRTARGGPPALRAFGLQLLLNAVWTPVFFGLHAIGGGLLVIVALWAALGVTIVRAWRVSRLAGALLIPYWLWVSFAALLNGSILALNPRD